MSELLKPLTDAELEEVERAFREDKGRTGRPGLHDWLMRRLVSEVRWRRADGPREPVGTPRGPLSETELALAEASAREGAAGRRRTHTYKSAEVVLRLTEEIRRLRDENALLIAEKERLLERLPGPTTAE